MTRLAGARLLAAREIRTRVRSKAFVVSTMISLAIILAVAILPGLGGDGGPASYRVAVAGEGAEALAQRLVAIGEARGDLDLGARVVERALVAGLVDRGEVTAAVIDGERIVVKRKVPPLLGAILTTANAEVTASGQLVDAGVDPSVIASVLNPAPLRAEALEPTTESDSEREAVVTIGTFLLYGQLLGFGWWIASGLVEEKTSRVVEVLLAKVRPADVLIGKVGGIGLLAFAVLIGYAAIGLIAASLAGTVELPGEMVASAAIVVAWFVPGFLLYSCLFAVAGALAARPEALQSTTSPITLVAMVSLFAAVAAGATPDGTIALVTSFIPFSAPLVLPIRATVDVLPWWHAVLGLVSVGTAITGAMWLAGRVYAGGALKVRGTLKLREALART